MTVCRRARGNCIACPPDSRIASTVSPLWRPAGPGCQTAFYAAFPARMIRSASDFRKAYLWRGVPESPAAKVTHIDRISLHAFRTCHVSTASGISVISTVSDHFPPLRFWRWDAASTHVPPSRRRLQMGFEFEASPDLVVLLCVRFPASTRAGAFHGRIPSNSPMPMLASKPRQESQYQAVTVWRM